MQQGESRIARAWFGPLSRVPGPRTSGYTAWPLSLASMAGRRVMYIHELGKRYGPVIRIAPNEVAINDLQAVKQIHKVGSGFLKPSWYSLSTGEDGNPGMFAMIDSKAHAARRKMFSQQFSKNGILEWEGLLHEKFADATEGMRKSAVNGKVDLMVWWAYLATDLIGEMCFGENFETLQRGQPSQYNKDMQQTSFIAGLRAEFPTIVRFLWNMPIQSIVQMKEATARVQSMGREAYLRSRAAEKAGAGKRTIFSPLGDDVDVDLAENESKNLLIAGSDTTMVTLTYLIWIVLKNPQVRARVAHEIATLGSEYSIAEAEALGYTQNVLQESLRLYGAGPGSLPRSVPKGGVELAGYYLPEGTVVSTQAYVMHRDPNIFEDPEAFIPDRWDHPTRDMKDAFMPFGGGTRVCLGMHLARFEMLLGLIEFMRAFPEASIDESTTDESMSFENYFLVAPKSHKCLIKLF
ncbi:hypothetical protein ACM66B_002819 [Microbotryomycetes sp. NB124-2]